MRGRQGMKKKAMVKSYSMTKGRKGMKKGSKKKAADAKNAKGKLKGKQKNLPDFIKNKILKKKKK